MIVADIALWSGTVTDCHDIDNLLIMAVSQQETAAEFLKVHLQDQGWAITLMKTQGPCATVLFLEIVWHRQLRETPDKAQHSPAVFCTSCNKTITCLFRIFRALENFHPYIFCGGGFSL